METSFTIRMATPKDAEALLNIYRPYVKDTAISFEYEVPSIEEFTKRIQNTLKKYPYLVILDKDMIVGYSYVSSFRPRPAYDWSVETTIYIKQDYRGKGAGKALYLALEKILKAQNIINLNASIAVTAVPDIHLSNASSLFHEKLGYTKVAHFTKSGYKFNTWYDMIWMEKLIGEHPIIAKPIIPIYNLDINKIIHN